MAKKRSVPCCDAGLVRRNQHNVMRVMQRGVDGRSERGFTLVELLVVVAPMGIGAGLLLPALARAKLKGTIPVCLANHRALQLAWLLYAEDNQDWLPPNCSTPEAGRPGNWAYVAG